MSKTAREICIEYAKASKEEGLKLLRKRYVDMITAL